MGGVSCVAGGSLSGDNLRHLPPAFEGAGDAGDHSELLQSRVVAEAVQAAVAHVNEQVAEFERIRRFKIVPRDFSIEQGELTPTMKIRRAQVIENHRDLVSELYLGK